MRILLVEDDAETSDVIASALREQGHETAHVANGLRGFNVAMASDFSAIILDRMLPGLNGLELVKRLRSEGNETPVLFLTSMDGLDDRVEGLNAGGDDYLGKPFVASELLARVNALTRHIKGQGVITKIGAGDLELDLLSRVVTRGGQQIELQAQEFRLLEYLLRNAGRVVTRVMLLENIWGIYFDPRTNIVETHISRLRAKIDRGFDSEAIRTVRGTGYIIRSD